MSALDTLKAIATDIENEVENDAADVGTFFTEILDYAKNNIKPAVVKAVADATAAAESAFESDQGTDRYAFAFSNAIAKLASDGVAFAEADVNFAIEAVVQARKAREAIPTPDPAA